MIFRTLSLSGVMVAALALSACGTTAFDAPTAPAPEPAIQLPVESSSQSTVEASSESAVIPVTAGSYILNEGDRIGIQVFDEADLTMDATVSASGIINYSYLGDLRVAGKTARQLEQDITDLLRNGYLVNPSVNVSIVEFRPFFIGGEVRSPGSYPYQPGLNLEKAIALAGGLTDRGSTRRMFIVKAGNSTDQQKKVALGATVGPGDIISIREGFF